LGQKGGNGNEEDKFLCCLHHADALVLRRFRACAGESPPGDDGLTEVVETAGTASDDRK
jgi:hypothetical protein